MAETYKKLAQELVDNSNDTLLTVAANTTVIIKSMRAVNTTGTAATLKLFHDGTAAVNMILPFVTIAANGWAEFDGTIIMEAADTLIVSLGGVVQEPNQSYTVTGDTITFTPAPAAGTTFWGVSLGDTLDIGTPSDKSVTSAKLATTSFSFFIS